VNTNSFIAYASAVCLIFGPGCRTKTGAARVNCGSLAMYQGEIGALNTPQLKLGHVIVLSEPDKKAFQIGLYRPGANQIDMGPTNKALMESFKSQFTIDFDATIPQGIQISASNTIAKTTVLVITNYSRVDIQEPIQFLNQNTNAISAIQAASSPSNHVIFVTTIVPAEFLKLAATNTLDASATANLVKVGNYKLHITYSCNDELLRLAEDRGSGAFFKYIPIRATNDHVIQAQGFSEKLSDYDFSQALR
jgi:hypothetical protein